MTKRSIGDLVATWANIFKSIPSDQLEDLKQVEDLWNGGDGQFKNPTREEIKTGPAQEASGGGAERMVRQYSDLAPQMGLAEKYAEFQRMLNGFGKSMDDMQATLKAQGQALAGVVTVLTAAGKAKTAKAGEPDDTTFIGKAEIKLRKARAELRKAEMADEDDEREERKSRLEEARNLLKSVKRLLAKADDGDDDDENEERAEKARSEYRKLTASVLKAEKKDDEEEREAAEKAATEKAAAEKAVADAKAATEKAAADAAVAEAAAAAASKSETGSEAGTETIVAAVKSPALAPVDPSVKGQLEILQTTVKGLMDVVMAGSKHPPLPQFISKAQPVVDVAKRVDEAIEAGDLENSIEIMKAQTLVTHVRAVQDGRMDAAIVDDEIARAPDNVRQLFQPAQAAA